MVTYHRFARGYLASRGRMTRNAICSGRQRDALVSQAVAAVAARHDGHVLFRRPPDFFSDEIQWISRHGIGEESDYVRRERTGRAQARLIRGHRPAMYEVLKKYHELRTTRGYSYDWDDLAGAARRSFAEDDEPRLYRHVVIDEGQDFSPEMVRSLALAIPEDGSLTMFADVAQQIYGRRISWSDAGLQIAAPWQFAKNYRNSPQIAALGLAIAEMPYYAGEPDMVAPTEFAAEGPRPTVVTCSSEEAETAFVIEQARSASQSGSVAILLRRRAHEAPFRQAFPNAQHLHRYLAIWNRHCQVSGH